MMLVEVLFAMKCLNHLQIADLNEKMKEVYILSEIRIKFPKIQTTICSNSFISDLDISNNNN